MKWSLFNWKKPVVSSGEPEDYQVVKNTVSQNERNITNINNQLANTVTTNTEQTITGNKNFNSNVVISRGATPLVLKGVDSNKHYLLFKNNSNETTFSLGSNTGQSSFEVNRGDLLIQTQENNKVVSFETSKVNLNRAVLQTGVEINAGFGGNRVKFIPEDTTTKTLQFYNENPGDARRFNLLVPEPTQANNPTTKNYVDNKETAINNQINTLNTFKTTTETNITNINNSINELNEFKNGAQGLGLNLRYQDLQLGSTTIYSSDWGSEFYKHNFSISTLQETKFLAATIHFKGQSDAMVLARSYQFTYGTTWGPEIWFSLVRLKNSISPNWRQTFVRIFYIDTLNTKTTDPYFLVEEVNNEN